MTKEAKENKNTTDPFKTKDHTHHSEQFLGSREDMLKVRASKKAEIQARIDEILKDYDGGPIAIVRAYQDTDGKLAQHAFAGGCGSQKENAALGLGLMELVEEVAKEMGFNLKG